MLLSQADADRLASIVLTIKSRIAKWPASQKFLQKFLVADQNALDQFKTGNVLTDGHWVTLVAYQKSLEEARKLVEERQRQAEQERGKQIQAEQTRIKLEKTRIETEKAAREKQIQVERASFRLQASQIETSIASLQATADELASATGKPTRIEQRTFALQRKLHKSQFESLYQLGPYVFQCVTIGGEACALVTRSVSMSEGRSIKVWVRVLDDIDVTTVGGTKERITLFVEVEQDETEVRLQTVLKDIEGKRRELEKFQKLLRAP